MSNTISSAFRIFATLDGSTISGSLRVDGYPLVQSYTPGTSKYVPDFESSAISETEKPTIYPVLRDQGDGSILVPNQYEWRYNDVLLTFDDTTDLSTNSGMEGTFKRIDSFQANIGGQTYPMQAIRVMKNLASTTNHDNDRITLSGTIEVGGTSVPFKDLGKDVVIQEATSNQYTVVITNDAGSALTDDQPTLTESLEIYKDGVLLADRAGITYQWFIAQPDGKENLGTAATQVVTREHVDNFSVIGCDVNVNGSLVATAFDPVTDYGDPYDVKWNVTGMSGDRVTKGETPTLTPVPVRRSTGAENPSLVTTWDWGVWDNSGQPFVLTGKSAATFQAASVSTTYDEVRSAGGALSFIVSAEYNITVS